MLASSTPALVVMAIGLIAGLLFSYRLLRRESGPSENELRDLELKIADLERTRDEIYDRLRGSESVDLNEADRVALERSAAKALRELELLKKERRSKFGIKERAPKRAPAAEAAPAPGLTRRYPALAGALLGGGMVALVAVLIFWAQRDAQPRPPSMGGPEPAPAATGQQEPAPLPPFVASRVAELEEELSGGDADLPALREMAELYLSAERPMEAFDAAQRALAIAPDDADALYVQGVVRYMMGQTGDALELLDRSLRSDPSNTQAALLKGLFLLQLEDRVGAVKAWESGLEAAGGSDPRLEHLLQLAREGRSAEEILNAPPPPAPASQ